MKTNGYVNGEFKGLEHPAHLKTALIVDYWLPAACLSYLFEQKVQRVGRQCKNITLACNTDSCE